MKSYFLFCVLVTCIYNITIAQDSTRLIKLSFRTSITLRDDSLYKGWLANISDSSVQVTNTSKHFGHSPSTYPFITETDYAHISTMRVKRNNGAGRGAFIGAAIGLVSGIVAGFIMGDDKRVPAEQDIFGLSQAFYTSAETKAAILGLSGATVMAGAGAIIGSLVKKTFIIGGNKQKFDSMRLNILDKAYRQQ